MLHARKVRGKMSRPATGGDVLFTWLLIFGAMVLLYVTIRYRTDVIRADLRAIQPCAQTVK